MEVSVAYNLMIRCILCIGIYICLVAGQLLALYGEGRSIKYMQVAGLDLGLASSMASCVPSATALPRVLSSTEPVARVPVQSASMASPFATQLIAYSKYGSQFTLEDTRKVFGHALSVLPL